MDAVKFYNEAKRICKYYKHCAGCIADVNDDCAFDMAAAPIGTDEVVALVEQWAKEHPRKTRQSVFLEHYPEAKRSEDGVLTICPMAVSAAYRNEKGGCKTYSCVCDDCRREFWMQEVE